ncbi:MAG: hypothetical protein ACK4NA_00925 [Alphaproteobacteria bacterium]
MQRDSDGPATFLAALTALERRHDGPLPPAAWEMLRFGSRAAWTDARRTEAAALQRTRALALLASAGRWRRRQEPERSHANLADARQALQSWRDLALVKRRTPVFGRH